MMSDGRHKRMLREQSVGDPRGSAAGPRRACSVTVSAAESPLGCLLARGRLAQRQYDAGERLRADWERAQFQPRVTMAWTAGPGAGGPGGRGAPPRRGAARA